MISIKKNAATALTLLAFLPTLAPVTNCAAATTVMAVPLTSIVATLPADEAEARRAMERAFEMLRAGEYGSLYDALPSASQRRVSRQRFVSALERTRGMYDLDRLEIGAVRVAGDVAAVDTVMYGRARRPLEGEGKIVARQYMVREGGRWRVAVGDAGTIRPLLAAHPKFARQFPPTEPRIFLKRDGRWVDISAFGTARRRPQ